VKPTTKRRLTTLDRIMTHKWWTGIGGTVTVLGILFAGYAELSGGNDSLSYKGVVTGQVVCGSQGFPAVSWVRAA
jgi:hypothetical protein